MFARRFAFIPRWACLCALVLFVTPSLAADPLPAAPIPTDDPRGEWEALVAYWNDYPFVSDGAGPTGSIEIAIRRRGIGVAARSRAGGMASQHTELTHLSSAFGLQSRSAHVLVV